MNEELMAELEARQTIREQPFRSDVPIVGPLIAWFRAVWNSISTRWYVLPLLQQQNEFNGLVVSYLREMDAMMKRQLNDMDGRLNEINDRSIDLDRDQTALTRNVAELSYQLIRMNQLLAAIEAQLQGQGTDSREA